MRIVIKVSSTRNFQIFSFSYNTSVTLNFYSTNISRFLETRKNPQIFSTSDNVEKSKFHTIVRKKVC